MAALSVDIYIYTNNIFSLLFLGLAEHIHVLAVEWQCWFFISLVMVRFPCKNNDSTLYLSIIFVIGFVGLSSKLSPIYGGLGLIMSGGVGCGIILNFDGSFFDLMVFLIYLGVW